MKTSRQGMFAALAVLGGGVGLAALAGSASPSPSSAPPSTTDPTGPSPQVAGGPWVDADAPRRIRAIAAPLEVAAHWPGLGDFLAATAWIESRGNPKAGATGGNAAQGWFQVRPVSAKLTTYGLPVSSLKDERDAVALAADYAQRLRKYAAPGQVIDFLALRRGWAYPSKVDVLNDPGYREQFARGLASAGLDPSFMEIEAFGPGFQWPGIDQALALTRGAIA